MRRRRVRPLAAVKWHVMAGASLAMASSCAGYHPPPDLAYTRSTIVSGRQPIQIERFAPASAPGGTVGMRRPGVLVLHTSAGIGATSGALTRQWADALAHRGYVAYVVHYFDRTGHRHTNDATEARRWPVWTAAIGDALTALREDAEVDTTRTGVVGLSLGGYLALALGSTDPRPDALVVVSGGFFRGLGARVDSMRATGVQRFPPTLLLHGTADGAVPFASAERVDRILAHIGAVHVLVPFPGEDHLLAPGSRARAAALAARFLADPRRTVVSVGDRP